MTAVDLPFILKGHVVKGKRVGRNLGYPTINLAFQCDKIDCFLTNPGVYACNVRFLNHTDSVLSSKQYFNAVCNIGYRPTMQYKEPIPKLIVEVHIFDFSSDVYNFEVELTLTKWIRKEKTFENVEELRKQIQVDVEKCRQNKR